jgi:hypothetical protein
VTEGTALGDYLKDRDQQANNPAAPAGARQGAGAGPNTALGQWLESGDAGHPQGYAEGAQHWLTGANPTGTENGWDNQFVDTFVNDWGKALEEGRARTYFEDGGTGVVTWDHTSSDGKQAYTFGDVYDHGKKTGNLYDMYDRDEANLMLAPFVLDAETQVKAYSSSDPAEQLAMEIDNQREDRNQNFENSLKALEFEGDVEKREKAFREGFVDEGVVGGSAVLGGALAYGAAAAAAGSVAPGVGTLAAGAAGLAVGGVGAFLNKDSLTEQAARAYEITSLSKEQFGLSAGISTGVQQWSGFGMNMISPIKNLEQGLYDWGTGDVGDGTSEFYRTDEQGKNKAPGWMRAVDVAATVGDSLLQFSSGVGLAAYSGSMAGTVGGQVAELAATHGSTFDPRRGGFDNIFTDENGNFDASAAAAGIGNIGIDAVQLGMARGLAGRANALRTDTGLGKEYGTISGAVSSRLPLWMGGSRGLAAGEERVRAAGFSFTKTAEGQIAEGSMRPTLGLLAPSEQLSGLSARFVGMREAALRQGAYSADDFYRAAHALANGERKIQTALVNGMGEGYEEAVQAVLEPHSHGGVIDAGQIAMSALYGAASGVGMQAAMGFRQPSTDDRMFYQAQLAQAFTYGTELTRDEWAGMSDLEKRTKAGMSKVVQETAAAALRKLEKDQATSHIETVAGFAKVADAIAAAQSSELAKATDSTDRAFVITQLEEAPRLDENGNLEYGQVPIEGVAGSARQILQLLTQHLRGLAIAHDQTDQMLKQARVELAAAPADQELAARVADLEKRLATAELTLSWGQRLSEAIDTNAERIRTAADVPILEAEVAELNDLLRRAFHREIGDYGGEQLTSDDRNALARAVSLVFIRDPQDQKGSYQVLLPQVSSRLTASSSDNVLEISHAVLSPISGDYDGDKIRQQAQLVFDDAEFALARGGGHFIGAGAGVNIGTPKYEVYIVDKLAESFGAQASTTLQVMAQETLNSIGTAVRARYNGVIEPAVLDEVLGNFYAAVKANDKDARATLMDGLADLAGGEMTKFGFDNWTNEWLWLDQLVVSTFQRFQEAYATHRPDRGPDLNNSTVDPVRQDGDRSRRRAEKRATLGQTLAAFASGDSLFRKFQKLHYTAIGSPVLSAAGLEPSDLADLAQFYRELSQSVTRSDLEAISTKDDITGRVFTQLNALARAFRDKEPLAREFSQAEAMLVIANMQVQDLDIAADGTMSEGRHNISLAQMLLKQSIMQDRREKSRIIESSPELQAKYRRLEAMTRPHSRDYPLGAEDAMVEVFGSFQMYTLLGDQANVFGPHLTVEQYVREFSSLSELERRDTSLKLKTDSAYLGKKQSIALPYSFDDMGSVSAYRSMVDSILKVGAGRITMDLKTGVTSGELVRRSEGVSKNLWAIHANIQQALRQFLAMPGNGKRDGETTESAISRMIESNPDVARAVMDMIPNNAVGAAFTKANGRLYPAAWLYEFFTISDHKAAEMHYWRNVLIAQWRAKGLSVDEEVDDGEHARKYSKLTRRMHRVMYNLARGNPMLYTKFIQEMEQATDLDAFLRWVNTYPGIRVEGAPIVGWVDDVAEFDKDKAAGGWTTILEGAELRESLAVLQQRTKGLTDSLAEEDIALKNDTRTLAAVRRVIRKERGEDVQLESGDRELYNRLQQAIDFAGDWYVAMGPQAMVNQTLGALRGFYGQAHTKGKNPEYVEPAGSLDAGSDALDYTTGYERFLASVTSVNLDAVGANLSHAMKDGGRTMDDFGRQVEWSKPDIETVVDLFSEPETRPMVRAMLFPQVLEVDSNNQLRPQLLFGKSLSDLLRGVSLKEMFPVNDSLSNDAAFKYASMIDGRARRFGGHHALQRAANDLVAARTSSATHVLSEGEEHKMVVDAYRDIVMVLQAVGTIAASPKEPGTDPLADFYAQVKKAQRLVRTAKAFGLDITTENDVEADVEAIIQTFLSEKETEHDEDLADIGVQIAQDPANTTLYEQQRDALNAEYERFQQQIELLRSDDMAGEVAEMFSLVGSDAQARDAKDAILRYITTHMSMIERSQASRITLNKLTQQLSDSGRNNQVDLTDKEWKELSNAVIGVYLDDALNSVRTGGSVSPWPDSDGENARNQKYYDTSWSYLVDDLLRSDSPLVKAAAEIASSNYGPPMTTVELTNLLDRTVLDNRRLGPWTPDIIGTSIEANQRLDSASAAMAIAMAGNSPKRQAAIMAAAKRTFEIPDEALLSTARISAVDLGRDLFDDFDVQLPGTTAPVSRPLAQLNNRFARSVVLEYTDDQGQQQTVDLMPMVGREWVREISVRDSGFKEIHIDRIRRAIDRKAGELGFAPAQSFVNIEFFHPDSQPDTVEGGPNWYNNIYFEGTSFKLDSDSYESLVGSLWFSPNGLSQTAQRKALDAAKLGKPAIEHIETATSAERAELELAWESDLAGVLREKTRAVLKQDVLELEPEFYNAIYKDLKLRHFVRGTTAEGDPVLWSAEQVILFQQQNPGQPLPFTAELWIPSDDVLRTMLGEQGGQGVSRPSDDVLEFDLSKIPPYKGPSPKMMQFFSNGVSGEKVALHETRIGQRARQGLLRVNIQLDDAQRSAFDARMQYFEDTRNTINADRAAEPQWSESRSFNPEMNMKRAVEAAGSMIKAENLTLFWAQLGIPFGPRSLADNEVSRQLLQSQHSTMNSDGFRTGWIYVEGSKAQPLQGLLNQVTLSNPAKPAYRVAPGDLVVVQLDSFNGDHELAQKRIDHLRDQGAIIVLGGTDGRADMRADMSVHLMSSGYEQVMGSPHVYRPIEMNSRYQNPRSRLSMLTETRTISRKNRVTVFSVQGREVTEGAAWINPNNERLGSIAVSGNLVPTSAFAGFGVPVGDQIDKVRQKIFGLNTDKGRALMKELSHGNPTEWAKLTPEQQAEADSDFDRAFDEMLDRLERTPGVVVPQAGDSFGLGSMIPLIDNHGRLLFYRHGMKAPRRDQIDLQSTTTYKDSLDAVNIAVYPSKREKAATIHGGTVVEFRERAGYGFEVELDIALQAFGNKIQLEFNGMKYVTVPWPDSLVLPTQGIANGLDIDMVSDLDTLLGKEAVADMVDNHANAFAYFGIDFLPDMTKFFFGGDGKNLTQQSQTREILHAVATRAERIPVRSADELIQLGNFAARTVEALPRAIAGLDEGVDASWMSKLGNQQTNESKIAAAMLVYLMTPGARVDHVLRSGGFNDPDSTNPDHRSRVMPRLFTQIFDDAELGSDLRTEINERLNDQIQNAGDGTGYVLHQDFTFESRPSESGKTLRGFLSFPEAHASGDNPVKNGMTFDDTARQTVSAHSSAIAYGALGVETAYAHDISKARVLAELKGDAKDLADGGAWRTLTAIPKNDDSFKYWHAATPAEAARRSLAREAMVQYRQEIVKDEEHHWTPEETAEYDRLSVEVVQNLGLLAAQKGVVDFWVRQQLGRPAGFDEQNRDVGRISGRSAIAEVQEILWAVQNRYLPTVAGQVPLMHLHDLQMIYRANRNNPNGWKPRESVESRSTPVTDWDGWTKVALGSALTSDASFDPLYLLSLDGFMHTYQSATRSLMELPVSVDSLKSVQLMDPQLNTMLVSINAATNEQSTDPFLLDAAQTTINEVLGGKRIAGRLAAQAAPASEIAKRRAAIRKWRKENDVPIPVDVTMKNFRKNSAEFVDEGTTTNAFIRGLIQLRLGTALINPALYVSMGPEQWLRGSIDRVANIITGQSTAGMTGQAMAKAGWSRYTPEQIVKLNQLYRVLGQRNDFKALIYKDLGFHAPHGPGGRITRTLEAYGRFGTSMQDPTYGMRADTVARRYLEAALQHILATPTLQVVSVENVVNGLMNDPQWLKRNMPDAHQAATNAVAQIRSMKNTVLNHTIKGIVDPLSESRNPGVNVMANLLLKIPLLFSNYAANVATSILGLQGLDQMVAMGLHGRSNPKSFAARLQAKMRGEEFDESADSQLDMSTIIEGVDLSRAFIRGGLTHAGLFAFGMWAAGLGISGEDDEMRRRRLMAENQGVGNIYDPRRIENDFRNSDGIFLDALPFGLGNLFDVDEETGRAMYHMNWMLKQFVSPVIGIEKFFETGDFRHVTWGFEDALGSFPLVNTMMWEDAVHTAGMLTGDADTLAADGEPTNMMKSVGALTRAVGTYERMLFENSFINQLYIGMDRYDRDPYVLPLPDSDGTLQRDVEGNVRPQNLALETFYDPETKTLRRGYMGRSEMSTQKHILAENRATFAFVSSLFTGGIGDSDYWRYNMPVKTRTFEKAPTTMAEVTELYKMGQGTTSPSAAASEPAVTVEEVLPQVRNHLYELGDQSGHFYTDKEVWAAARTAAAAINAAHPGPTALSYIDPETQREHPTEAGAMALMMGLYHGSITFESAAMRGFYVTRDMREQIQADWTKQLVQEGIDLGLDQTKAVSRMKRIMYGPLDNPSVSGLNDIIWAPEEKLSYSPSATYAQLNTTYVIGPDGMPWATGFERSKLMGALGLAPLQRQILPENGAIFADSRMNIADIAAGLNTGLRALEPLDDTRNIPTDVEIGKSIEKAIEDAAKADYTTPSYDKKDGSSGGSYGSGYHSYGGYGGGGSSGGGAYFQRLYALPDNVSPYGNSMPFVNTSNPIIRRANVRRERVWSERGRLNQWQ